MVSPNVMLHKIEKNRVKYQTQTCRRISLISFQFEKLSPQMQCLPVKVVHRVKGRKEEGYFRRYCHASPPPPNQTVARPRPPCARTTTWGFEHKEIFTVTVG